MTDERRIPDFDEMPERPARVDLDLLRAMLRMGVKRRIEVAAKLAVERELHLMRKEVAGAPTTWRERQGLSRWESTMIDQHSSMFQNTLGLAEIDGVDLTDFAQRILASPEAHESEPEPGTTSITIPATEDGKQ